MGLTMSLVGILPLLLVILPLPAGVSRKMGGLWASFNVWLLQGTCGIRVRWQGTEYISDTPVLYAAKHQSALETLALGGVINNTVCVVKRSLFYIPVFGWFLRRAGMIGIDRKKGRQSLRRMRTESLHAIASGCNLAIFPEGTRTAIGAKPDYKAGVYDMYKTLNVPVVPIALNTGLYWQRNRFIKTAGTATIQFLAPIPAGLSKAEFMHLIEQRIETQTHILCTHKA